MSAQIAEVEVTASVIVSESGPGENIVSEPGPGKKPTPLSVKWLPTDVDDRPMSAARGVATAVLISCAFWLLLGVATLLLR